MKKLSIIVLFLLAGIQLLAQPFEKSSQAINAGIGFGNTNYFGTLYEGFIPSISGSYEYGIVEVPMGSELTGVVGVGGYLGWSASKYGSYYGSSDHYNVVDFIIAARGNYHFIFHDKLDPYAGIWFGANIQSSKWKGDGSDPDVDFTGGGPTGGAYVGARWYFTDNIAVYSEIGYLISVFNVGATFKLK